MDIDTPGNHLISICLDHVWDWRGTLAEQPVLGKTDPGKRLLQVLEINSGPLKVEGGNSGASSVPTMF